MGDFDQVTSKCFYVVGASDCTSHLEGRHPHILAHDVGLLHQLRCLSSLTRIDLQQSLDNLGCPIIQRLMVTVLASLDSLVQVLLTCASEWESTRQHHIQ